MTHNRSLTLLLAACLTLSACKGAEPAAEAPAEAPAEANAPAEAALPTEAVPALAEESDAAAPAEGEGLSGEAFLAQAQDPASGLSGSIVTLGRCSLLTTPGSDGTLPCRILDKDGQDLKDATGLPMDIFFKQSELSPEAQAVVAACEDFCNVQISGKLEVAPETFYLSMTEVSLKALD